MPGKLLSEGVCLFDQSKQLTILGKVHGIVDDTLAAPVVVLTDAIDLKVLDVHDVLVFKS